MSEQVEPSGYGPYNPNPTGELMHPKTSTEPDDLDLGAPLSEPFLIGYDKPPRKARFWSALSFLFAGSCFALDVLRVASVGARLAQQSSTPKTPEPAPKEPPKGVVDCDQGKYAELCSNVYASGPPLPLHESERCLAIGLVLLRSSSEIEKQNAYFAEKTAYFDRKLDAVKAGRTSEEEDQKLLSAAERHDRQAEWYQKVFEKSVLLEKEYESKCREVSLHPDITDAAIEGIALAEYASLWK